MFPTPGGRIGRQLAAQFEKAYLTHLYNLHVLLFNTGQVTEAPIYGLRQSAKWLDNLVPPEIPQPLTAPVLRWLNGLMQTTERCESVRHARDAFR